MRLLSLRKRAWAQHNGRSARLLCRVDWKLERGEEAGLVIVQQKLAVVQMGDGFGQCEAEPGTLVRAARVEAPESLHRLLAAVERDAGPAVGDFDPDLLLPGTDANVDVAA